MHGRIESFTRRQVRARERLFNPETLDRPDDDSANWDYFLSVVYGFGAAIGLFVCLIFGWIFWDLVTWP